MRRIIADMIFILAIMLGLYVGGYCMFISPILDAARAFDQGTLTGTIIVTTILKCFFAGTVGVAIVYVGAIISSFISYKGGMKKEKWI